MTARAILHVDMDAFFASIEQRDDPALRGRPVLVGGTGRRAVVAAASYEARTFGCHSAMPMAVALRLCPHASVVKGRYHAYREASERVFAILESFTPLVQPLSIDEAFLDVTGSERLLGSAVDIAKTIRRRIRDEVRLTASVGVAPNKFIAKLASDMDKPDGLTVVTPDTVVSTLAPLPISRMWGVGPATGARLATLGVRTFADLAIMPLDVLERCLGSSAARLRELASGRDDRAVVPDGRARSISQERTFGHDLPSPEITRPVLLGEVEQVARRLRKHGFLARTATTKIRFGDFQTITRSMTLDPATDRTRDLWAAARTLFDRWASSGFRPVRLIGFGASNLTDGGEQRGLFSQTEDDRDRRLDRATDAITTRFGRDAIHRGVRD